ncbi:MAG: helix-turn-helix transcriptional regulator [Bacteroidales bacterium]|nr:helix-turn-helix transcriptional regulator [Bacteroidales bacterium]
MHNHSVPFIIMELTGSPRGGKSPHGYPGHPASQHPDARYSAEHHQPTEHPAGHYPASERPASHHPATEHPAAQHPATEHPAALPRRSPMHCFIFLVSGTILAEIGGNTCLIKEHQLAIIPEGQSFTIKYYDKACGYMGGFTTQFLSNRNQSENLLSEYEFLNKWVAPRIELDQLAFSRQLTLFQRIYEEFSAPGHSTAIIKAYLNAILAESLSLYEKASRDISLQNNSICNRFLEELFNNRRGEKPLSVNEYAQILHITPNHLNKVVKGATGKSTSAWIEEAVMLKAKILLKGTDLPLGEVAAKVGIMDQSYFTRKFKLHTGVTPSDYRKEGK